MAARKRRSPLLKLMRSEEDYVYETCEEDVRHWFGVLNREIFDGALTPIDEVDIRWRRKQYAFYEAHYGDYGQVIHSKLALNKKYRSKKFFIEVLGHELIHHYQALYNDPLGHGPSFLAWGERLNKKGIDLVKVYRE
jgi:hypothetical protein